jgi:hypothetical protein
MRMLSLVRRFISAGVAMSFDRLDDVLLAAYGHITRLTMYKKYNAKHMNKEKRFQATNWTIITKI